MKPQTTKITTPFGKHEVEVKEWITGRDRERINEPLFRAVQAQPKQIAGKHTIEVGNISMEKTLTESAHREIEAFIVSIDGTNDKILDRVLDMHEDDVDFIKAHIEKITKKKDPEVA